MLDISTKTKAPSNFDFYKQNLADSNYKSNKKKNLLLMHIVHRSKPESIIIVSEIKISYMELPLPLTCVHLIHTNDCLKYGRYYYGTLFKYSLIRKLFKLKCASSSTS